MSGFLTDFVKIMILAVAVLVVYNVAKKYILYKVKLNKWIILSLALIVLVLPGLLKVNLATSVWGLLQTGLFVFLFLWFFDNTKFASKRNEPTRKNIEIKPKAKPNRVKNMNKDNK